MSDTDAPNHHFRPEWAIEQLPGEGGTDWRVLFEHGSFELEIYAPRGHDPQKPHDRDEIYVVISGTGTFTCYDEVLTSKYEGVTAVFDYVGPAD